MDVRSMKAMVLERVVEIAEGVEPLRLTSIPKPTPRPAEVLIRVSACGVCHTELDEIEGRTAPPRFPVVPGHEAIGRVVERGPGAERHAIGDRVGVGWIFSSSGDERENLSERFLATGRDANGGYAEFMTVPENYAYPIPDVWSDFEAAPLLCAGAVGYRALRRTGLRDGERLGLMGFGGSAHLVLQLARERFPASEIYVFARDRAARDLAIELGARWAGDTESTSPESLDAIIDTTPAWMPVVASLSNLRPGGRLVINAIRKEDSDKESLLRLSYRDHLWMEREIRTVANVTRFDVEEFLGIAARIPIRPLVELYPFELANQALRDLKLRPVRGAKVLRIGG